MALVNFELGSRMHAMLAFKLMRAQWGKPCLLKRLGVNDNDLSLGVSCDNASPIRTATKVETVVSKKDNSAKQDRGSTSRQYMAQGPHR